MKQFLAALFVIMSLQGYAQPELGECDKEVEELAKEQIPKALKHWRSKNYREAERYLRKAIMIDEEHPDALYLLGDLYVRKMQLDKAEGLWNKLLDICPNYKPEVKYFLGSIVLENDDFEKAITLFEDFLDDRERDFGFDREVEDALAEAKLKKQLYDNPIDFNPKPVRQISTQQDEYLATISPDQQTMYFTRRSKKVNRMDGPAARTRLVEEFSSAERQEDGSFEQGSPMPEPFNQNYNEGGPSITADNTELYFTVCEEIESYKNCDIYFSERDAYGYWTTPQSVGDHINRRNAWESQASVSANGDALYFASNREGGVGGLDIYKCVRQEDGTWSHPKNLGNTINTREDEKTPFIHSDSRTLYFTSNGHQGLGGFDIFYAKANSDTTWQQPQNIGYPINTKKDDLGLFVSLDGATAYFATDQRSKANGWDIYSFHLPAQARPEEVALITGQLTADNGDPSTDVTLEFKNVKTNEVTRVKVDKETGSYARVVDAKPDEDYIVSVKKKGVAFSSKYVNVDSEPKVVSAPLAVEELEVGKEYTLNDINFESNSYQLDHVARSVIDEFIIYLKENPELRADIQGHTDNVGDAAANMSLSKNRAKTVYDYVLSQGIPASRLSHHGYGETKPIADNDTEKGRAKNRRTVFVITSK